MKIGLIACCSKKEKSKMQAKNFYISTLFKYSLEHLEKNKCDKIFILSAKYCLLDLDEIIKPYDITLNNMKVKDRKEWANAVLTDLNKKQI